MRERIGGVTSDSGVNVLDGQTITGLRTPARLAVRAQVIITSADGTNRAPAISTPVDTVRFQSGRIQLVDMHIRRLQWHASYTPEEGTLPAGPVSGFGIFAVDGLTADDTIWDGVVPAGNLTLEFELDDGRTVVWDLTAF